MPVTPNPNPHAPSLQSPNRNADRAGWCAHGPDCQRQGCRDRIFAAGREMPPRQDPGNKRWKPQSTLYKPPPRRVTATTRPDLTAEPCPKFAKCCECLLSFETTRADAKYCGSVCRQKAYRKRLATEVSARE